MKGKNTARLRAAEVAHDLTERRASILIVDDEPRNLLALRAMLEELDADVVTVDSGAGALKQVLDYDFAAILLDVYMQGMDGYEVAEIIRGREKSRHIPIIFLTAVRTDKSHMFRGYSAGAVDYVLKPVEPLILKSKLKVFIELFRQSERIRLHGEEERRLLTENLRVEAAKLEAEQALRRSEVQRSLIIQSLPVALYSMDPSERSTPRRFVDEKIEEITGFAAERFVDQPDIWISNLDPADRDRVRGDVASLLENGSMSSEYRWRCADGSYRSIFDHAVLVRDREDGTPDVFGTWLDVTERRHLEEQLAHAQKLEALGQLTGGIAHDFNNMLTVVVGSLERLRNATDKGGGMAVWCEMALQGALRCSELTKRLLAFARRQPLDPERVDINAVVNQASDFLRMPLGEDIKVEFCCAEPLWPALVDPLQLESALLNLTVNARDAMPNGGTLRVITANVTVDEDTAKTRGCAPGDYVIVSIADTGIGMPKNLIDRVFEPFFTTKDIGQGTGLGLSMIYGFVRQSNGHIAIDSEVNKGTTVSLYLPRDSGDGDAAADKQPPAMSDVEPSSDKDGVILVVEDDQDVRCLTVNLLRDLGYRTVEAGNATAALGILKSEQAVQLLFTDWQMPGGMNGHQLAVEARKMRPGLAVLHTSAHVDQLASEFVSKKNFLGKPYRGYELAAAVQCAIKSRT